MTTGFRAAVRAAALSLVLFLGAGVLAAVPAHADAVDRHYHSYLGMPVVADAAAAAAVVTAAHAVLVELFPEQKIAFDVALTVGLAHVLDGAARTAGVELGKRAAAARVPPESLQAVGRDLERQSGDGGCSEGFPNSPIER